MFPQPFEKMFSKGILLALVGPVVHNLSEGVIDHLIATVVT
jgi:hypothetical protein